MQRAQPDAEFSSYSSSPLHALLSELLAKTAALIEKYARHERTPSKIHATDKIKYTEKLLKKMHLKILPRFSHGNAKPGLAVIIAKLISYKNFLDEFKTREGLLYVNIIAILPEAMEKIKKSAGRNKLFALPTIDQLLRNYKRKLFKKADKIPGKDLNDTLEFFINIINEHRLFTESQKFNRDAALLNVMAFRYGPYQEDCEILHPMMLEFAIEVSTVLIRMPRSLRLLLPFFNPDAISFDLTEGAISAVLSGLGTERIALQHVPDAANASMVSFKYLTTFVSGSGDNSKQRVTVMDIDQHYVQILQQTTSLLISYITHCYHKHPDGQKTQAALQIILSTADQYYTENADVLSMKSENARAEFLRRFVQREISVYQRNTELCMNDKEAMQDMLLNLYYLRNLALEYKSIKKFLVGHNHHSLLRQLKFDKERGFNTIYARYTLPDYILGFSGEPAKVMIIPIRIQLIEALNEQINRIKSSLLAMEEAASLLQPDVTPRQHI